MKNIVVLFLVLSFLPASFLLYAQEYDDENDFHVVRTSDGNSVIITGYKGAKQVVSIPPLIRQLPVSAIGVEVFKRKNLTSISIPNSVTTIESQAFEDNQLTSIDLPNSLTSIGLYAFSGNQLTNLIIPNSVINIGAGAFSQNLLTNLTISHNISSIENFTFSSNLLTNVIIPDNVFSIGEGAFLDNQLIRITIGHNVSFYSHIYSSGGFDFGFDQFYKNISQKAGTYIYSEGSWGEEW